MLDYWYDGQNTSFNRTFMELKLLPALMQRQGVDPALVALRN